MASWSSSRKRHAAPPYSPRAASAKLVPSLLNANAGARYDSAKVNLLAQLEDAVLAAAARRELEAVLRTTAQCELCSSTPNAWLEHALNTTLPSSTCSSAMQVSLPSQAVP